jgi:5-methylcytosine-specific restriction protein B
MALWIQPARVTAAISSLSYWRKAAQAQAAMHLWPLLALAEAGAAKKVATPFTETREYEFWDRYARFPEEKRERTGGGGFAQHYYIDALSQQDKPSDYPHRSPWTIRTRTFLNSWHASDFDPASSSWTFKDNFADIFVAKVLSRGGVVHRTPVVDLAVWLFREESFEDSATAESLEERFLDRFRFDRIDYEKLFEFTPEDKDHLFTPEKPLPAALTAAIRNGLVEEASTVIAGGTAPPPVDEPLEENDPVMQQIRKLIAFGTSGVILKGCPGTSKTWYAKKIARSLSGGRPEHVYQVQFHPAYGYEDFVEGYLPDESSKSGFKLVDKVFLQACDAATSVSTPVVIIIDEINRGDPARIFGEILTYIEHDYRGLKFRKAYSGAEATVPANLFLIGTMNAFDRSITQLDLALIRRLDHIDLKPSSELVASFLEGSEFSSEQIDRIVQWFDAMQTILPESSGGIGHTYFKNVRRPDQLQVMWDYRMLPYCEALLELEPDKLTNAKRSFDSMYRAVLGQRAAGE